MCACVERNLARGATLIIKLKEVDSYYINLDKDLEKKESILSFAKYYGLKDPVRVPAIKADPYQLGLAASNKNALLLGIKQKKPFLVLEDDAYPLINIPEEIVLPDNADAVYLGCNTWGVPQNHILGDPATENGAQFFKIPENNKVFKVKNILSSHAILYINPAFAIEAVKSLQKISLNHQEHLDIQFYKDGLFEKFNVYVTGPIFYQHDIRKISAIECTRDVILSDFAI